MVATVEGEVIAVSVPHSRLALCRRPSAPGVVEREAMEARGRMGTEQHET
jgi:hypothetical protein